MSLNFKTFLRVVEYVNVGGAVILPSSWTGTEAPDTMSFEGRPLHLPSLDLALPAVTRSGRISVVVKDKNPIYVQLHDGTKLFFTHDEFRRIKGWPEVGRTMTVVFQRNPDDKSDVPSKIHSCQVS